MRGQLLKLDETFEFDIGNVAFFSYHVKRLGRSLLFIKTS